MEPTPKGKAAVLLKQIPAAVSKANVSNFYFILSCNFIWDPSKCLPEPRCQTPLTPTPSPGALFRITGIVSSRPRPLPEKEKGFKFCCKVGPDVRPRQEARFITQLWAPLTDTTPVVRPPPEDSTRFCAQAF